MNNRKEINEFIDDIYRYNEIELNKENVDKVVESIKELPLEERILTLMDITDNNFVPTKELYQFKKPFEKELSTYGEVLKLSIDGRLKGSIMDKVKQLIEG